MCIIPLPTEDPWIRPLEVLCLWEGWWEDRVHESEDLQCLFKCFEESYKYGVPILGIHSPKRMSALLNQVGNR